MSYTVFLICFAAALAVGHFTGYARTRGQCVEVLRRQERRHKRAKTELAIQCKRAGVQSEREAAGTRLIVVKEKRPEANFPN